MGFTDQALGGVRDFVKRQIVRGASEVAPKKDQRRTAKAIDDPLTQAFVKPGVDARRLQNQNLGKQEQAQRTALAEAGSQQRAAGVAKRKANQRSPNISALLSSAIAAGAGGVNSTLLHGLGGNPTGLGGQR